MGLSSKTDIWMPLYIGDYLADTSHLDAERHGCYLLWMMHYWRKGPLPNHIPDLVSIGSLRGENAPSIAQALLDEFFSLDEDDRWHQARADKERALWQKKKQIATEKASKAASARWENAPSIAQALLNECPSPSPSPLPIKNQAPAKAMPPTDPGSELMAANWLLEELGVVADNGVRRVAADAIRLLAREGGTVQTASDYILEAGKAARTQGEVISRFWFTDQKYRPRQPKMTAKERARLDYESQIGKDETE